MSACLRSLIGGVAVALVTVPGILARGDGGGFGRLGGYHGGSGYSGDAYRQRPVSLRTRPPNRPFRPRRPTKNRPGFIARRLPRFGRAVTPTRPVGRAARPPRSRQVPTCTCCWCSGRSRSGSTAAPQRRRVPSHGWAKCPTGPNFMGFYGNVDTYTRQLRALERFVAKTPSADEGRFLLGFQYAMLGHQAAARSQFLAALRLAPQDRLAAELLTRQGGTVPPPMAARREPRLAVAKN